MSQAQTQVSTFPEPKKKTLSDCSLLLLKIVSPRSTGQHTQNAPQNTSRQRLKQHTETKAEPKKQTENQRFYAEIFLLHST
jgi:hypothetical protein